MKINNIFSKLLISMLIILTIFNFMYSNFSFAVDTQTQIDPNQSQSQGTTDPQKQAQTSINNGETKVVNQLEKENLYSKIIMSA